MTSYEATSQDMLFSLQHIVKKLSQTYTVLQVKYYLYTIILRTQVLSLQIRLYLTHDLFSPQGNNGLRVAKHTLATAPGSEPVLSKLKVLPSQG